MNIIRGTFRLSIVIALLVAAYYGITGHAHKNVGAGYGAPTLEDMAVALKRFPQYKLKG